MPWYAGLTRKLTCFVGIGEMRGDWRVLLVSEPDGQTDLTPTALSRVRAVPTAQGFSGDILYLRQRIFVN